MNFMRLALVALFLSVLCGCHSVKKESKAVDAQSVLKNDSLLENFWNNFSFSDTAACHHNSEPCFDIYAKLLSQVPYGESNKAIDKFLKSLKSCPISTYEVFLNLADKYFYSPNSPFCDDELYRPFLLDAVSRTGLDFSTKERLKYRLEINGHNRPGHKATDFTFETIDHRIGNLYSISSHYLMIYFNNPGCHECKVMKKQLGDDPIIKKMISTKTLQVLSVYPDDNMNEWLKNKNEIPNTWINAHDRKNIIKDQNIYDLKAIPTIYLLDANKNVILKDPTYEKLKAFFGKNLQ